MEHLCLYEDYGYERLLPLVYFRPVFELLCGAWTLSERVDASYPDAELHLLVRDYLAEVAREMVPAASCNEPGELEEACLFLNGRLLDIDRGDVPLEGGDEVFLWHDEVVGFRLRGKSLRAWRERLVAPLSREVLGEMRAALPAHEIFPSSRSDAPPLVTYPWDLVEMNPYMIESDAERMRRPGPAPVGAGVVVIGAKGTAEVGAGEVLLSVAASATVDPSVVIDIREGPVLIGEWTVIRPPTIISGPCYIGDDVIVDGAKIRPGTSIGDGSRVAGEIEQSILLPFVNKRHGGFIGHSYLCSWINLGALTTNSDLKNNYSPVRVTTPGGIVETGLLKVGCFLGDHAKTGIGTLLDTGAIVGPFCNVLGGKGPTPQFVPAFSWASGEGFVEYDLERAIATARTVLSRRDRRLGPTGERLIRHVFSLTTPDRTSGHR